MCMTEKQKLKISCRWSCGGASIAPESSPTGISSFEGNWGLNLS